MRGVGDLGIETQAAQPIPHLGGVVDGAAPAQDDPRGHGDLPQLRIGELAHPNCARTSLRVSGSTNTAYFELALIRRRRTRGNSITNNPAYT